MASFGKSMNVLGVIECKCGRLLLVHSAGLCISNVAAAVLVVGCHIDGSLWLYRTVSEKVMERKREVKGRRLSNKEERQVTGRVSARPVGLDQSFPRVLPTSFHLHNCTEPRRGALFWRFITAFGWRLKAEPRSITLLRLLPSDSGGSRPTIGRAGLG